MKMVLYVIMPKVVRLRRGPLRLMAIKSFADLSGEPIPKRGVYSWAFH